MWKNSHENEWGEGPQQRDKKDYNSDDNNKMPTNWMKHTSK